MPKYIDISNVENYLLISIDPSFESQVEGWIDAVEKYIENETGIVFIADEENTTRKYDGNGSMELIIDYCVDVDEIIVNGSKLETFLTYPANRIPIYKIARRDGYFPHGKQNIEVRAKWGYSAECPTDIILAATVLTAGIINYSLQSEGEVQSESIGNYSVSYKTEQQQKDYKMAMDILERYKQFSYL